MSGRTGRFLSELEASFDASLAREEEEAAGDLARSFRNDEEIHSVLARSDASHLQTEDGRLLPLVEVGSDYAIAGLQGDFLVHLETAIFTTGGRGHRPRRTDLTWLAVARSWAAEGRKVQVRTLQSLIEGFLIAAARDFVTVERARRSVFVPHAAIRYLRSCPED